MNAREQHKEFLDWLKAKQSELAAEYYDQTKEGRMIYRRLLILIKSEIHQTERELKNA